MNYTSLVTTSLRWYLTMQTKGMKYFLIPATLLTIVTLLIDPLLLFCILSTPSLRRETRYLLLANTLLSDILFLIFNLANIIFNTLDMKMHNIFCEFILVTTVTTYCSSVLTVTLMVIDTFLAVRWPLRYNEILPLSRVKKIVGLVWAVAATYPLSVLLMIEVSKTGPTDNLKVCLVIILLGLLKENVTVGLHIYFSVWVTFCFVLVLYCYIRLYVITKNSGIWSSRYSRARLTLLVHITMLVIYFTPGLIFIVQLGQFEKFESLAMEAWLNTANLCLLMVIPRACAPYLYGLRYREIYEMVQIMVWKKRQSQLANG